MGPLFLVFLTKPLSKCPSSTNLPPTSPEKFLVEHLHSGIIFCKTLHLKCLTVFWIPLCLYNCSVMLSNLDNCLVTLYYVLHRTHSEFWHIQHSVFLVCVGIFNYIQHHWGIFTHIETLLRHIQAYSDIFSTLYNHLIFTTTPYSEP